MLKQIAIVDRLNGRAVEHSESRRPGELLVQDTLYIGGTSSEGVYLHAVVDAFSGFAFGFLYASEVPEGAVAILHNEAVPFYRNRNMPIGTIVTDTGREFYGNAMHLFQVYLALNNIRHWCSQSDDLEIYGAMENFKRMVLDDFLQNSLNGRTNKTIEVLQRELDIWLRHYNYEKPRVCHHQLGRTPGGIIESYLSEYII